ERVARRNDALEATVLDAREQADPVTEPFLLGDVDGHRLGKGLDLQDAGHDGEARKVALEEPLRCGHGLRPYDAVGVGVVLDDAVDEQERPAVRNEVLDLTRRVDRPCRRAASGLRSEEHTSELQSPYDLVCR